MTAPLTGDSSIVGINLEYVTEGDAGEPPIAQTLSIANIIQPLPYPLVAIPEAPHHSASCGFIAFHCFFLRFLIVVYFI
jgi:hypothetical protein